MQHLGNTYFRTVLLTTAAVASLTGSPGANAQATPASGASAVRGHGAQALPPILTPIPPPIPPPILKPTPLPILKPPGAAPLPGLPVPPPVPASASASAVPEPRSGASDALQAESPEPEPPALNLAQQSPMNPAGALALRATFAKEVARRLTVPAADQQAYGRQLQHALDKRATAISPTNTRCSSIAARTCRRSSSTFGRRRATRGR